MQIGNIFLQQNSNNKSMQEIQKNLCFKQGRILHTQRKERKKRDLIVMPTHMYFLIVGTRGAQHPIRAVQPYFEQPRFEGDIFVNQAVQNQITPSNLKGQILTLSNPNRPKYVWMVQIGCWIRRVPTVCMQILLVKQGVSFIRNANTQ